MPETQIDQDQRAIDRLSRSIESDHAYMSDAEWEAEIQKQFKSLLDRQERSDPDVDKAYWDNIDTLYES